MEPILVTLDKPREIRWTHRADARLGSLERAPGLRDLVHRNPHRGYYALLAFVWASLVEKHEFAEPEALADFIHSDSETQQHEAFKALRLALIAGGVIEDQKKTVPNGATASLTSGLSPSSNSAPPVPTTST